MMNIKFIKLPKALFEGIYTELSSEGKLLYSLLLDRSLLSEKNSLTDDNGRVIVYFTNSEVCDKLKCSHDKATKLFRELERFKLICRHKQGKGKPDLIYVRQITRSEYSAVSNADNQDSGMRQISVNPLFPNSEDIHSPYRCRYNRRRQSPLLLLILPVGKRRHSRPSLNKTERKGIIKEHVVSRAFLLFQMQFIAVWLPTDHEPASPVISRSFFSCLKRRLSSLRRSRSSLERRFLRRRGLTS